VTGFLEEE